MISRFLAWINNTRIASDRPSLTVEPASQDETHGRDSTDQRTYPAARGSGGHAIAGPANAPDSLPPDQPSGDPETSEPDNGGAVAGVPEVLDGPGARQP